MPKFLEKKLKKRYGAKSKVPYKIMNAIGAMRGNKETAKGAAMEAKHARDTARGKPKRAAKTRKPRGGMAADARSMSADAFEKKHGNTRIDR